MKRGARSSTLLFGFTKNFSQTKNHCCFATQLHQSSTFLPGKKLRLLSRTSQVPLDFAIRKLSALIFLRRASTQVEMIKRRCILANFWKKEVGTLEIGCDIDYSDREALLFLGGPGACSPGKF